IPLLLYTRPAPPDLYTLSLHDALPICGEQLGRRTKVDHGFVGDTKTTLRALLPQLEQNGDDKHLRASLDHYRKARKSLDELAQRSEEHTSELQSPDHLVCRLLLEKKNK